MTTPGDAAAKIGKVIEGAFTTSKLEATIDDGDSPKKYCRHRRIVTVSCGDCTVSCGDCNAVLDAFDVLMQYASSERTWKHWHDQETKVRTALHEAEEQLKRVKARTRAASRKDAEEAVRAERRRIMERLSHIGYRAHQIAELSQAIERFVGWPYTRKEIAEIVNPNTGSVGAPGESEAT